MKRFTALFQALDATTKTSAKVDALASYFAEVPAEDGAWALAILTGHRPRGTPSSTALRDLAGELTGYPPWLVRECWGATGDFSEAIALMLGRAGKSSTEPLHRVMEGRVLPLAGAGEDERKRILREALARLDAPQRLVYLKLVRGGLRVGVQRRTVARALARVASVDQAVMLHRLSGGVPPTPRAFRSILAPEGRDGDAARPYPFFLAHQLHEDPDSLGDVADWRAEPKWDGIRAQLLIKGGVALLWSRGEEIVTHQFPEIEGAARAIGARTRRDFVLDGEIVAWRAGEARGFAALQTRLNRKAAPTHQLGLFERDTVVFQAFDIMEVDGEDVRTRPLRARLDILDSLLGEHADDGVIRACRPVEAGSWADVAAYRDRARELAVEGVMLKHLDSVYGTGRVKVSHARAGAAGEGASGAGGGGGGGWWKWKVDPLTVDCVLMYAQLGSGRRAGLYTDYTFGVWDDASGADTPDGGAASGRRLTTFAKAYSGLTQDEIEALDTWIRAHTTRRYGPVREVEPVRVFELGFDSIRPSDRHKSGLAVRFPRILRARPDKPASEADTVEHLRAMAGRAGRS